MPFIKNLFVLLAFSCVNINAYMLQPVSYLTPQLKPKIRNVAKLYMSSVPDYDPSKLINSLARSTNDLDKWSLKDFLSEVAHKHVETATLIKNPATESLNAVVLIDNNYK